MDDGSLDFIHAQTLVLARRPSRDQRMNAVFLHARAKGDGDPIIDLAAELMSESKADKIFINGYHGERFGSHVLGEASEGWEYYRDRLIGGGVDHLLISRTRPAFNTRQENTAFLDLAIEHGCHTAIIVAWPHQLLRAVLGLIAEMNQRRYWLQVYTKFPDGVQWRAAVAGSQGANPQTRFDEIAAELKRIEQYMAKGDLATFRQLFSTFG